MNWNQKWKTKKDGWSQIMEENSEGLESLWKNQVSGLKKLGLNQEGIDSQKEEYLKTKMANKKTEYLSTALQDLGLKRKPILGDGNCFYYTILDQLKNNGITHYSDGNQAKKLDHTSLRKIAVDYIKKNPELYTDDVCAASSCDRPKELGGPFKTKEEYIEAHSKDKEYADQVINTSLSRALGVNLVTIQQDTTQQPDYPTIIQKQGKDKHTLYLYHVNRNHYESLRPNKDDTNFKELEDLVAKAPIDEVKTPAGKVHLMTQEAYDSSIKKNPEKNKDATVQFQSKTAKHIEDSSEVIIGDLAKAESIIDTIAKEAGHKIDPSLKTLLAEDLQYNLHHKENPQMLVKNLYEYMKELKALPQHSSSSMVDNMKSSQQSGPISFPHIISTKSDKGRY